MANDRRPRDRAMEARRRVAVEMFREGHAPSECDRRCALAPGTTRAAVAEWWALEAEEHERGSAG